MQLSNRARTWLPWLLLAAAVVVTAVVYWPGVTGGWVFDDYPNIVENAAIHITRGHSTLAAWINSALSSPSSFLHRPLASITFSLNWYAGGGNPWPFKVTNLVIHLLNGVLVFCVLRTLLQLVALRWPSRIEHAAATRLAWVVAAAWMLLPINLMAVLYVVQRMESLCQVFVLAGLWAYLHGRWMMLTATDARRDQYGFSLAVGGIVLGTVLGLTSKETAVLLPVFAFLAEAVVMRFRHTLIPRPANGAQDAWEETDSGFRPAAGPGMTKENEVVASMPAAPDPPHGAGAGPAQARHSGAGRNTGATKENEVVASMPAAPDPPHGAGAGPAQARHSGAARNTGATKENDVVAAIPAAPDPPHGAGAGPTQARHSGAARSAEPGTGFVHPGRATRDKRIWTLFTVTLFIPAALGFAWLLRGALRAGALAGRDFTLAQRLLTEPRVLVDYLHWTLLPNPMVLSLYHDEIVKSTGLLAPWTTLGAIVFLAALIVVAVWLRNRRPLVTLGIGWIFAGNLLTATIVPLELVYEQRMYFSSIGVLLAAGALLLGLRWKIALPLLRGFLVTVALLWFAVATNLRAREWSNPLRLAVAEAQRHPESPRAVYEAGRLLLIASDYKPGQAQDAAWKYLRQAAAIPGSSALSDQAMIMLADHRRQGADADYWHSMIHKLASQPTRQEDISALISLTNCYESGICQFNVAWLERAYAATLSRPHPIARLDGAYADFQRDILHNDVLATEYLARAVAGEPSEPAYRVDLAALYARQGETEKALEQIDALRRMNLGGRLDRQIAVLVQLAEQGRAATP